jgi:hypothetical protein
MRLRGKRIINKNSWEVVAEGHRLRWLFFAARKMERGREEKIRKTKSKNGSRDCASIMFLLLMLFLRSLAACFDTNIRQHQEYW